MDHLARTIEGTVAGIAAPTVSPEAHENIQEILDQIIQELNINIEQNLNKPYRQETDLRVIAHIRVNEYYVASLAVIKGIEDTYYKSGWTYVKVEPTYTISGTEYMITLYYG
jgi:hypothetical protein